MEVEMSDRGIAIMIVIMILTLSLGGFTLKQAWAEHDAKAAAILGEPEQVKIFVVAENEVDKLEKTVNAWLKENDGKVDIYARTQSSMRFAVHIAIWYKVKK